MTIYTNTQLCGDKPTIRFWQHKTEPSDVLYCSIEENLILEARHIRLLAAALDALEVAQQLDEAAA